MIQAFMFYYVSGPVTVLEPGLAVVDCGGVGYGCRVTAYTSAQLKLNQNTRLYVTESIREDAHDLYGFISKEEQRCYELLTSVNGVGPKVADCALLFGFYRLDAFPMDVWMKRAMATLYPDGLPENILPYRGIAQQYLFHYARMHPELFE